MLHWNQIVEHFTFLEFSVAMKKAILKFAFVNDLFLMKEFSIAVKEASAILSLIFPAFIQGNSAISYIIHHTSLILWIVESMPGTSIMNIAFLGLLRAILLKIFFDGEILAIDVGLFKFKRVYVF
jgi:hypothetical protein